MTRVRMAAIAVAVLVVAIVLPLARPATAEGGVEPRLAAADGAAAVFSGEELRFGGTVPAGATNPRGKILRRAADGLTQTQSSLTATVAIDALGRITGTA